MLTKEARNFSRQYTVWIFIAVILTVSLLAYWVFKPASRAPVQPVASTLTPDDVKPPLANKAILTLSTGSIIELDSTSLHEIASEGGVSILKATEGELHYKLQEAGKGDVSLSNMIYNPKGSDVVKLVLADGTRVWLNNESSLKYPVSFDNNERKVELTGEAYFEVANNPSKKFIVTTADFIAESTGGRFHINHYHDEVTKWLNLLDGSVRVAVRFGNNPSGVIKPGQQAQVSHGALLQVLDSFQQEKVLAWKNAEFVFENDDLRTIMLQVSGWYNISPIYKTTDATRYTFRISRKQPLSAVLTLLQRSGSVQFQVEGKDVFINPLKSQ